MASISGAGSSSSSQVVDADLKRIDGVIENLDLAIERVEKRIERVEEALDTSREDEKSVSYLRDERETKRNSCGTRNSCGKKRCFGWKKGCFF